MPPRDPISVRYPSSSKPVPICMGIVLKILDIYMKVKIEQRSIAKINWS